MEQQYTPEQLAQEFHEVTAEQHHDMGEYGSCWCCCAYCDVHNPFAPKVTWRASSTREET